MARYVLQRNEDLLLDLRIILQYLRVWGVFQEHTLNVLAHDTMYRPTQGSKVIQCRFAEDMLMGLDCGKTSEAVVRREEVEVEDMIANRDTWTRVWSSSSTESDSFCQ